MTHSTKFNSWVKWGLSGFLVLVGYSLVSVGLSLGSAGDLPMIFSAMQLAVLIAESATILVLFQLGGFLFRKYGRRMGRNLFFNLLVASSIVMSFANVFVVTGLFGLSYSELDAQAGGLVLPLVLGTLGGMLLCAYGLSKAYIKSLNA